ncbi:MAG: GNAT family N-acetyltransferase [Streptococcus sp.]|nr:GNAT family N-acetyltransferase [Streptococcus sp.]
MWYQKEFKELELKEFYEIVQLRLETFVVEQIRIYNDLDNVDYRSIHLFHQNEEGRVDAYARIFETGATIHFGRVAVAKGSRGQGLGKVMVEQILDLCEQRFPGRTIEIEAQEQVVGLYEKLGFQMVSEPFILASTPHVKMIFQK